MSSQLVVVLDFDGTITVGDNSDALFEEYGDFQQLIRRLMAGEISVAEYYTLALASLASKCPPETLEQWCATREVDPGFTSLIRWLQSKSIRTMVVSDGFDAYIEPILHRAGCTGLPVSCNTMRYVEHKWIGEFPGASESCSCFCASCKRNAVVTSVNDDDVVVYVGDGRSDTCAVQHADVVFAKGYLASWCTEQRIPHHPYRTLADVQRILSTKLSSGHLRQRRQAVLLRRSAFITE